MSYHFRSEQLRDMTLNELLTRLEFCAKDMRDACHPDHYDQAQSLAWEIMNALSHHRENPWGGIDSKFKKAPYIDDNGKNLLERITESRKRK